MRVTGSRDNLEHTLINGQHRHIEGTSSKIKDHNVQLNLLVKTISDGGSSGLIQNSHNVQTSDSTGILSGLSLTIIEIGWNSHHDVLNARTKIVLSNVSHLL